MATTGRLDLSVWRNDDVWEFPLRVRGPNLTGVALRGQIRLAPDTPGDPLVNLATVTVANAEGIRLASATLVDGAWTNDVRIRLNKSTRQGLPYAGELGQSTPLAWAMQIGGRTRLTGSIFILAHTIDSDTAPTDRPFGFGGASGLPSAGATLTINAEDVVALVIDGADLIGDFAGRAETAAEEAVEKAGEVAAGLASIATDAPIGPLVLDERPMRETRSTDGKLIEAVTQEGNHIVVTPAGTRRVGQDRATIAPIGPLISGERPLRAFTDQDGRVVEIETVEGGRWIETDGGLIRTEHLPPEPSRYDGEVYAFVGGEQTRKIRYPADEDVWLFLIGLGQSNMMGQNTSGTAVVGATPLYPDNAWMFEGGPRRNDALPNRTLVPLIETTTAGQRETPASGWANHLIRDVEAATGRRPNTLSVVCALGATPYVGLNRGSPTYAALLRALDDGVAAIRAKGGRRIITMVAWTQGQNDAGGGWQTPTRYRRQMQQMVRQLRGDIVERTGETEAPVVYFVQEGSQQFADPFYAPVVQADVLLDGVDQMALAGPEYSMPHWDLYHLSGIGQSYHGQMIARASLHEQFGQGWRAIKPYASYWTAANEVVLDFDLPTGAAPLVIDTSGTIVATTGLTTTAGFLFDDGSGGPPAITNVQIVATGPYAGMAVKLTLAAPPTGPRRRVGYALKRDASQSGAYPGQLGPELGPRGLLRGSLGHVNLYDASTQYDWCNSFMMDV